MSDTATLSHKQQLTNQRSPYYRDKVALLYSEKELHDCWEVVWHAMPHLRFCRVTKLCNKIAGVTSVLRLYSNSILFCKYTRPGKFLQKNKYLGIIWACLLRTSRIPVPESTRQSTDGIESSDPNLEKSRSVSALLDLSINSWGKACCSVYD